jgi:hypothetical protein
MDLRDGMWCDFMPTRVKILDLAVVRPLMADIECSGNRTTVWVKSVISENFFVQIAIQIVHRVVERYHHKLRSMQSGGHLWKKEIKNNFRQVWTILDKFRNLDKPINIMSSVYQFRHVWTSLDKSGQVWRKSGQVQTNLDSRQV